MFKGFKNNRNLALSSSIYWMEVLKQSDLIPKEIFNSHNFLASQWDGNPILYFYHPDYDCNIRIIQEDPAEIDLDELELSDSNLNTLIQSWEDRVKIDEDKEFDEFVISVVPISAFDMCVESRIETVKKEITSFLESR